MIWTISPVPNSVPMNVPPAAQHRAAEDDGGDRVEREPLALGRVADAELGEEDDGAGEHEQGDRGVAEDHGGAVRTPTLRAASSSEPVARRSSPHLR